MIQTTNMMSRFDRGVESLRPTFKIDKYSFFLCPRCSRKYDVGTFCGFGRVCGMTGKELNPVKGYFSFGNEIILKGIDHLDSPCLQVLRDRRIKLIDPQDL